METIYNYINGELIPPRKGNYLQVFAPSTGQPYAKVPNSCSEDVDQAFESANKAFDNWSELTSNERGDYLIAIANELEKKIDFFSQLESRDTGKPITLAKTLDIPRSVLNLKFFSEFSRKFDFSIELTNKYSKNTIIRSPMGVVGCISPWNLPLYLFSWKIAPALITGNTVIAKPSEITPFTAFKFSELCQKIGLPPGVLNIVHGNGVQTGEAIVAHRRIKAISFTGGTNTGKKIAQKAIGSFKKLALEMGGKNPAIIFSDCNYDNMIHNVVKSSFMNQGQICLCTSRILVEMSIYEKFKSDFINRISKLKIGDPAKKTTEFGAISSLSQFKKVMSYIKRAKNEGGKVLTGGSSLKFSGLHKNGWYIAPTVIEDVKINSKINQEEIFGPVVTLIPFKNESEAIKIANDTKYGLSATVWSEDKVKLNRVSKGLEAGIVWENCWMIRDLRTPFGGIKSSGYGKEGGNEAFRFFTEPKTICRNS